MAYSFSRPSAKRCLGAVPGTGHGQRRIALGRGAGRRFWTTAPGCSRPPDGSPPWWRPNAVLAARLGGHPTEEGTSVLLGGVPLDDLPARLGPARGRPRPGQGPGAAVRTLRELLDGALLGSGQRRGRTVRSAVRRRPDALTQGSLEAGDPMEARITERGCSPLRRPAPAPAWPGR